MQGAAWALAVCAVAWSAASRADDAAAPSQWQGPVAFDAKGDTIPVHLLDDPGNPYRGQYSAAEAWVAAHTLSFDKAKEMGLAYQTQVHDAFLHGGDYPQSPLEYLQVTPEGWVIPVSKLAEQPERKGWLEAGRPIVDLVQPMNLNQKPYTGPLSFALAAPATDMPADLKAALEYASWTSFRSDMPRIPAWLGSRPPLRAIFVPNGEIVTYGELNLHYQPDTKNPGMVSLPYEAGGDTWYRYSADGQLLAAAKAFEDLK